MQIPFAVLLYHAKINMTSLANQPAYAHYKAGSQSISSNYKISEKEILTPSSARNDITYYASIAVGVVSSMLVLGLALFSKRFRTPRHNVVIERAAASTAISLLEIQKVDAISMKSKKTENPWVEKYATNFKESCVNLPELLLGDRAHEHQGKAKASPHFDQVTVNNPYAELNPNFILAYWAGQYGKKLFCKAPKQAKNTVHNTKKSLNLSYKDNATFFVDKSSVANVIPHHAMVLDSQSINRSCQLTSRP